MPSRRFDWQASMLLNAKISPPQPNFSTLIFSDCARVLDAPVTYFIAPVGYLMTDGLSALLRAQASATCWVRLGRECCDPGALLLYLIGGIQQAAPGVDLAAYARMRSQPGPVAGWGALFGLLASDLAAALPSGCVFVIEGIEHLALAPGVLHCMLTHFVSRLPGNIHCVLITNSRLPRFDLPLGAREVNFMALRLDEETATGWLARQPTGLPLHSIRRSVGMSGGRATALAGISAACQQLGADAVQRAIQHAGHLNDLLARLVRISLEEVDEADIRALEICLRLQYEQPSRSQPNMSQHIAQDGPWMQPLVSGWKRIRGLWEPPLQAVLGKRELPQDVMQRAAVDLAGQNAVIDAVNVLLAIDETAGAACLMADCAEKLMDLGLWATLKHWLKQLPEPVLHDWPWLVYIQGKLAAAEGHGDSARRSFAVATKLFEQHQRSDGACLSLLAESALAAWRGEYTFSAQRALGAYRTAKQAGLKLYEGWSAWQLGSIAASTGDLNEALAWFSPAAVNAEISQQSIGQVLRLAENLILRQQELQRQRDFYQQAHREIELVEKDVSGRLRNLIYSSPENLDQLLAAHGWTCSPLLPISSAQVGAMPEANAAGAQPGILRSLMHALGWFPALDQPAPDALGSSAAELLVLPDPLPAASRPVEREAPEATLIPPRQKKVQATRKIPLPLSEFQQGAAGDLHIALLGAFILKVNGEEVVAWSHSKGKAVFKYLAYHRQQWTPKEILMDTFWPESPPNSARNNLNVALHNVRSVLPSSARLSSVIYQNSAYRLHPDLAVWLDAEEFEELAQAGNLAQEAHDLPKALIVYEAAAKLYQGDFLFDEPYEGWAVPVRERLRILYLDTLERLSQIHYHDGAYMACIAVCQRMLEHDNCREDAHSRLMRCYHRLGQDHLALRQYQSCADVLRSELDVKPSTEITQLYDLIRTREPSP